MSRSSAAPYVLALAVGRNETAQTMVGSMASDYSCSALHHVHHAFNAPRGKRTSGLVEWTAVVAGYVSIMLLMYFASQTRVDRRGYWLG